MGFITFSKQKVPCGALRRAQVKKSWFFADFGHFGGVKGPNWWSCRKTRRDRFSRKIKNFQIGQKIRKNTCMKFSKKNVRFRNTQKRAFWVPFLKKRYQFCRQRLRGLLARLSWEFRMINDNIMIVFFGYDQCE